VPVGVVLPEHPHRRGRDLDPDRPLLVLRRGWRVEPAPAPDEAPAARAGESHPRPRDGVQHPVERGERVVGMSRLATVDIHVEEALVEHEAARPGLGRHPQQGGVGQAAHRVAAAHVGVHAGEPDLPHPALRLVGDALLLGGLPQARLELQAPLVQGQRLARAGHDGAERDVVELVPAADRAGDAERSHRVEDAEQPHGDVPVAVGGAELLRGPREGGRAVGPGPVAVDGLAELVRDQRLAGQQPHPADHPDQAAGGVGATAEAEHEDLVAGVVVEGQEPVSRPDVVEEPEAEGTAEDPVDEVAAGPHAAEVEHQLLDAPGPSQVGLDGAGDLLDVRDVRGVRAVPGAVAADDQTLIHNLRWKHPRGVVSLARSNRFSGTPAGRLGGPGQRPRARPMISFWISVVPP
jgi:hypothetical protein